MPLPAADEGMPLFLQPQGLRGSAYADPQALTRQGGKNTFLNDTFNLLALSVLAALGHLSQGERQGVPARRTNLFYAKRLYPLFGIFHALYLYIFVTCNIFAPGFWAKSINNVQI